MGIEAWGRRDSMEQTAFQERRREKGTGWRGTGGGGRTFLNAGMLAGICRSRENTALKPTYPVPAASTINAEPNLFPFCFDPLPSPQEYFAANSRHHISWEKFQCGSLKDLVLSVTTMPSSGLPQQEQFHTGTHFPAPVPTPLTALKMSGPVLSVFQWGSSSPHVCGLCLPGLSSVDFPSTPVPLSAPQQCAALIAIEARPLVVPSPSLCIVLTLSSGFGLTCFS